MKNFDGGALGGPSIPMASIEPRGFLSFWLALALGGCGGDSSSESSGDGNGPGSTTASSGTTDDADGSATQPTDPTAASSEDTSSSSGSPGTESSDGTTGDTSDASSEATQTGDTSSSSEGGTTNPGCDLCREDEVCVVFQAFANTYECHPIPRACDGDVDCDCASDLCVDPFVACYDPPEPDTLFCACPAC